MTKSKQAILALAMSAFAGCSSATQSAAPSSNWVETTLASLTLREKVGQMIVPRISGAYMPIESTEYQRYYDWVVRQGVGGVIITQGPPLEMAAKLNTLQSLAKVPLMVSADMESGPGQILTTGFILPYGIDNGSATRFPTLMGLGATGDEKLAYDLGRITAQEGRAVGVHVTYAPVVDVNNNPNNPIINTRSYSEDPNLVSRMATAHIKGIQENGMIATAKHFPGHGDTGTDSHINLPVISVSRERAEAVELPPYKAAIATGVGAIMSAHIAFPAITGDSIPATLNPKLITGLLRNDLHYQGMVVTDAMDMGAIIKNYGNTNAAVMAVKAGADQLLQPLPQDVAPMIDAVTAAVQKGEIPESRINDAVRKVLQAKQKLGLDKQKFVDLNGVSKVVGNPANQARAQEAADRSITLVRNGKNVLPLNTSAKVLSVTYYDEYNPFQPRAFQTTLAAGIKNLRTIALDQNTDSATLARVSAAIEESDIVLFSPFLVVRANKGQLAIPERIARLFAQTTKPLVLTSFGSPYVLSVFPDIATYVVGWGMSDVSQRAAAKALLGQIPMHGRLPIAIPPFHKIGEGIDMQANK